MSWLALMLERRRDAIFYENLANVIALAESGAKLTWEEIEWKPFGLQERLIYRIGVSKDGYSGSWLVGRARQGHYWIEEEIRGWMCG